MNLDVCTQPVGQWRRVWKSLLHQGPVWVHLFLGLIEKHFNCQITINHCNTRESIYHLFFTTRQGAKCVASCRNNCCSPADGTSRRSTSGPWWSWPGLSPPTRWTRWRTRASCRRWPDTPSRGRPERGRDRRPSDPRHGSTGIVSKLKQSWIFGVCGSAVQYK